MDYHNETIREKIRKAFSLKEDSASHEEIRKRLLDGGKVTGTNMCVLVCAMVIASVGLNMSSTAVIIGAMLISPIMGSILASAFASVSADYPLLKNHMTGFGLQIAISITAAALYFLLSPVKEPTTELLARTSPTFFDVLIAFFGYILYWSELNRKNFCYLEEQLLDGNNVVYLSDYEVPSYLTYYILDWISWRDRDMEVFNPDSQLCIILAQSYHLDYVAFYPPELLDDMADKTKSFDEFTDCGYLPCYIKRKKEKEEIEKIGYVLRPATEEEKPWWVRLTGIQREDDGEISYDAIYEVALIDNEEWIFVKKYPELDQRLDFLEITYKESDKQ